MAPMDHYLTWVNAAWSEAARLRHQQIEPEHLLLGLIAHGGRATAILGAHGVTLARARTAVDALADADLARVGIRLPEGLRPEPLSASDLIAGPGSGEIPMSQAATELVDTVGRGAGDPGLRVLLALTARPQTPIARLVDYCGADAAVLCADAARAEAELSESSELTAHRYRLTDEYASYGLDRVLSQERFVSVPAADLAALLSDPAGLTQWAVPREELVELCADGVVQRVDGRRQRGRVRWRLEETSPGRIVWSCTAGLGPSRRRGPPRAGPAAGRGARRRPPPPDPGSSDLGPVRPYRLLVLLAVDSSGRGADAHRHRPSGGRTVVRDGLPRVLVVRNGRGPAPEVRGHAWPRPRCTADRGGPRAELGYSPSSPAKSPSSSRFLTVMR